MSADCGLRTLDAHVYPQGDNTEKLTGALSFTSWQRCQWDAVGARKLSCCLCPYLCQNPRTKPVALCLPRTARNSACRDQPTPVAHPPTPHLAGFCQGSVQTAPFVRDEMRFCLLSRAVTRLQPGPASLGKWGSCGFCQGIFSLFPEYPVLVPRLTPVSRRSWELALMMSSPGLGQDFACLRTPPWVTADRFLPSLDFLVLCFCPSLLPLTPSIRCSLHWEEGIGLAPSSV